MEKNKIVRYKPLASQYLDHDQSSTIPKGLILNPSSFNVRQYTNLRFEYRIELADINYREFAFAVEVANCLQDAVDTASWGGTSLPEKHLNPFQKEQIAIARHSEKLEWARIERFKKRKEELQEKLLSAKSKEKLEKNLNSETDLTKKRGQSEKITKKSDVLIQHGLPNSPLARLRSPEHLSYLKQKANEIKKLKEDAKKIAEKEKSKNTEIMLFVKKKKNKEFIDTKNKQYDSQFYDLTKEREQSARVNKEKQSKAKQDLAKLLRDAKVAHAEEVNHHKKEREIINKIYKECQDFLDSNNSQNELKLKVKFDAFAKLKDPWPTNKGEDYYSLLPIKLAQRIFTESLIVPQLISLKRTLELFGRSSKRQVDHHEMTFEEFKLLFFDVAVDFTMYGLKDPHYVRSSVILNKSAMLSAKSESKRTLTPVHGALTLNRSRLQISDVSVNIASPIIKAPKESAKMGVRKQALDRHHIDNIDSKNVLQALNSMVDLLDSMMIPTK